MAVTEQGHARRHHENRSANYRFDWQAAWRPCRMIDVCFDFAVVELFGADDDELIGSLHLRVLPLIDREGDMTIRTNVSGRVRLANGRVIVGVGFRALVPDERRLLQLQVPHRSFI
jgi:hypothetical protein